MNLILLRTLFLLLLVFLQISFFNILFPWFYAPPFLLGAVVALTLARGFPSALYVTVPLTLLFDICSLGMVTWFSVYAVFFAYGTSFLSRRLLIEHQGFGLGLYAFVVYSGVLLYQAVFSLIVPSHTKLSFFSLLPTGENLLFSLVAFLPLFVVTYFVVKRVEGRLELMSQRQFQNVR